MPDENDPEKDRRSAVDEKHRELQRVLQLNAGSLEAYVQHHLPFDLRTVIEPRDVLQDVFFEAFRRIDDFEPQAQDSVSRWLFTIARHRIFALIRSRRSSKRSGLQSGRGVQLSDVASMVEELALYTRTPSQSAMSHEIAALVQRLIEGLHPNHREAIKLRYFMGLSAEESAEKMGRSPASIFMLCRRGLKSLRVQLLEAGAMVTP